MAQDLASEEKATEAYQHMEVGSVPPEHWSRKEEKSWVNCQKAIMDYFLRSLKEDLPKPVEKHSRQLIDGWSICSIASSARNASPDEYTQEMYDHLSGNQHGPRESCPDGVNCVILSRLASGSTIQDKMHVQLLFHPPRREKVRVMQEEGFGFSYRKTMRKIPASVKLAKLFGKSIEHPFREENSDLISLVIWEVITNDYGVELLMENPEEKWDDEVKAQKIEGLQGLAQQILEVMEPKFLKVVDILREDPLLGCINELSVPLLKLVKEKFASERLQNIRAVQEPSFFARYIPNLGEVLSLMLYTRSLSLSSDVCRIQRNDAQQQLLDVMDMTDKWAFLEFCLHWALHKLHLFDKRYIRVCPLYLGVREALSLFDNSMTLNSLCDEKVSFASFTSASRRLDVAKAFRGNDSGLLLYVDTLEQSRSQVTVADVSWISLFPDEEEVVFSMFHDLGVKWKLRKVQTFVVDVEPGSGDVEESSQITEVYAKLGQR